MAMTTRPVVSLIQRYGRSIIHHKKGSALSTAPWKLDDKTTPPAVLMGVLQKVKSERNDALPEGGLKAVIVLLVKSGMENPEPGDWLALDDQSWRINTILPLTKERRYSVLEALVHSDSIASAQSAEPQSRLGSS